MARTCQATSWWFAIVLVLLFAERTASADVFARELSPYEEETVQLALNQVGAELEPDPEGKMVEGIEVVTLDVFEPRDPAPQMLNWFHVTTKRYIVEREVLLRVGHPYSARLAAETERNLRRFSQLSVVLLVPVRGTQPDRVRLLVITKDVWSLRLSWEPSFINGKLTSLSLAPAETNLFGTTQTVLGSIYLDANNYWLGGRYFVPRIGNSRIRANIGANLVFNCATDRLEGATGDFTYGQPLYSSLTRWSWQTAATWSSLVQRGINTTSGNSVCSEGRASAVRVAVSENEITGDPGSRVLSRRELLFPNLLRSERLRGQAVITRSFNRVNKFDISAGAELDWRTYSRRPVSIEQTPYQEVQYFEDDSGSFGERTVVRNLPPNQQEFARGEAVYLDPGRLFPRDRRISPYLQLHAFSNTFLRVINYETLGLQEDVQVGHDVYLRFYPAFRPLSSRDLLGVFASASYSTPFQGGFAKVLASSTVESSSVERSDVLYRFAGHLATPDVGWGRFIYDVGFLHQPLRYLSGVFVLDGTSRLRGYAPGSLRGPGRVTFNHEFRSRPVRMFSILAGLSLFHDVGTVLQDEFDDVHFRQGAGVGLRILAPQLDRDVFRIDFGFPLVFPPSDDPAAEFTFVASFRQAFSTPVSSPPSLLSQ